MKFNYAEYKNIALDREAASLLAKVYKARHKQTPFSAVNPSVLSSLTAVSKAQSTESSNRIEGIVALKSRIAAIMENQARPLTQDEAEIAGYRDVLTAVHEKHENIILSKSMILKLHKDMLKFTGTNYAGRFKNSNNIIAVCDARGEIVRTIFHPLNPNETPAAVESIIKEYKSALNKYAVDPLVIIPIFIHDFLCIHPFKDGNGRISRLLTLLLFCQNGFTVGKYISIEKIIENTKADYYKALEQSSDGWNNSAGSPLPFIKYILGVLLTAYREFEKRIAIN